MTLLNLLETDNNCVSPSPSPSPFLSHTYILSSLLLLIYSLLFSYHHIILNVMSSSSIPSLLTNNSSCSNLQYLSHQLSVTIILNSSIHDEPTTTTSSITVGFIAITFTSVNTSEFIKLSKLTIYIFNQYI